MNSILSAIRKRRSRYELKNEITMSREELQQLIEEIFLTMPSPVNSQSTRAVILLGEEHLRFWDITLEELERATSAETFVKTLAKVNRSFKSGYGTILFYEDGKVIRELIEKYPKYAHNFDLWATQTNGMHQFALWSALADAGIGASLQHYNELIDERIRQEWSIDPEWKLYAQMPFGIAVDVPKEKHIRPMAERIFYHE